jgi:predicted transglutaminase-like cysteine proteinase
VHIPLIFLQQFRNVGHTGRGLISYARVALVIVLAAIVWQLPFADEIIVSLSEKVLVGAEKKYGTSARKRLLAWTKLIADNRDKTDLQKLKVVNDFFNQIPYVSDMQHWGVQDYWATPVEMLASNGADCEDFAIAKYFTLVALSVSVDKLKITYVKATSYNPITQSHMVLTYYSRPDAVPLVLDNLINEIRPATQRRDLTPVYAFNGEGLWLAKTRSLGRVSSGSGNIRPWRELRARMGKEF